MHEGLAQPARHALRHHSGKGRLWHLAQHGIHQPGKGPCPFAAPDDFDRGIHRAMRRPAHADLHHRQAQHIAHHARRGLAQMRLQQPVHALHMSQHRQGQSLRPCPLGRGKALKRALRICQNLGQHPPLAQHRAQQAHRRRPRRQSLNRHAVTLVPLPQGRISTGRHKEPLP